MNEMEDTMNHASKRTVLLVLVVATALTAAPKAPDPQRVFAEDFSRAEALPDTLLILNGEFALRSEGGNRFLELPGTPLDQYGIMFGPTRQAGDRVSARFWGTRAGRQQPAFGVGLNGVGGYRLMISAAKRRLELLKGDVVVAGADWIWTTGRWAHLSLQVRAMAADKWRVEGKAWMEGEREPEGWNVVWNEDAMPAPGRASVWAHPYSGTPIRLDDLRVVPAAP